MAQLFFSFTFTFTFRNGVEKVYFFFTFQLKTFTFRFTFQNSKNKKKYKIFDELHRHLIGIVLSFMGDHGDIINFQDFEKIPLLSPFEISEKIKIAKISTL